MLAFAIVAFLATPASSHESEPDWPTAKQLAQVTPGIGDSIPMARMLVAQLRHRLDAQQLELLDRINLQLQVMQGVEAGYLGKDRLTTTLKKSQLVDYFRWKTEQELLKFLDRLSPPSIIEFDLRNGVPRLSTKSRIAVDEHDNLVLLRVTTGKGNDKGKNNQFVVSSWNFSEERLTTQFPIKIAGSGTTYVLLDLKRLPTDETTSHLVFNDIDSGDIIHRDALTFKAAARGQVAIDVVDDADRSVPVLMSISSLDTGLLREPAEAIDLRTVLNDVVPHLSLSGRGYIFYLPGQRQGRYWIVKPPLEMPLPEGRWKVRVLRGIEFTPIEKTVTVNAGQWTRVKLQTKRWTDMPALGWYSGDDHVHAQLQDSEDARKLIDYTRAVDINVANILEMGDVMRTYYSQRGFGKEFRVRHQNHWLVPGQEDPRSMLGHAIGLNLQSKVRDLDRYLSNDWVASEIHQQGGLYGHTHVGPNACFVHREMALFTPYGIVDFNSIMQADLGTELYYDFLNMGFKMTATAGADTPYGGTIGAVRTYAYTGDPDGFSPDDWFEAVRKGRTFVTNGPMIDLRIENYMPGDEIVLDENKSIEVSARAWGGKGWSAPKSLRLIKFGETVREVGTSEPGQTELRVSAELEVGSGFWIAAHAVSQDGSQAHTTPIYVARKGLRHWKVGLAEKLIDQQISTLREIELEVKKSEKMANRGAGSLDYWNRRTAEQAGVVLAMVRQTRQIYEQLRLELKDQLEN